MAEDYYEYRPDKRPDVEVLVDGVWLPAKLRAWSRPSNFGLWWGNVLYSNALGKQQVATVHESRLRNTPPPPAETGPPGTELDQA
jgi:hypothetical protein